jgi:hypothetical protein
MPLSAQMPPIAVFADPETSFNALLMVGIALLVVVGVVAALLNRLHRRVQQLSRDLAPLQRLESVDGALSKLVAEGDDLELRRLEHVLIDIRDGQRRLEERLLAMVETLGKRDLLQSQAVPPDGARGAHLAERITSRLLSLGFERIELLTPFDDLEGMAQGESEVLVEARRGASQHKGRVVLRDGGIVDVRMRDSYGAFP